MKSLQDRVNIVPVIAKADTLLPDELKELKKKASFKHITFLIKPILAS
jgi:septin family protein